MENPDKVLETIGPESVEADMGLESREVQSAFGYEATVGESKRELLDKIITLTAAPKRPPNSITAQEYADEMTARGRPMTAKTAAALLRQAVKEGKLEMVRAGGVGCWSVKSGVVDKT